MAQVVGILPLGSQGPILQYQYQYCWWPGNMSRRVINSHALNNLDAVEWVWLIPCFPSSIVYQDIMIYHDIAGINDRCYEWNQGRKGSNLFHSNFSPGGEQPEHRKLISSCVITTNCSLYSNISQILLLYKTWGYYNKFDSMKSLVDDRCVKIPHSRYMGHGLNLVQKHIAALAMCDNPSLVRDKPPGGAPTFVKLVYTMAVDDLLTCVARSSTAMVLTQFAWINRHPSQLWLIPYFPTIFVAFYRDIMMYGDIGNVDDRCWCE